MGQKVSEKSEKKEKKKEFEDKTFGLKNKNKSNKVKKYIDGLQKNIISSKESDKKKKEAPKKKEDEIAALFQTVEEIQKVPPGVDPKSILCDSFKKGKCTKGKRCAFSHDLLLENKKAKINLYADPREKRGLIDAKKLSEYVICKYFMEAVEQKHYGWFWICPNGGDKCPDVHAFPEGYVIEEPLVEDEARELTMEEFIETEREKLGKTGTPVTAETFSQWMKEHPYRYERGLQKKKRLTGRELFSQKPDMFQDDECTEGLDVDYKLREDLENVDEELFQEIEELEIQE
ncbi:MAG: CCCH-type zinc finger-containing protein [Amphiamblys sp. WSBS2006]|nr:MAG: CCCH-type zinc finger-containing protein [Amphiamblys sp. WSBS2006]